MPLEDQGIFVRLIPLPFGVNGFTVPNNDETYNVYINSLLSDESQRKTLEHELFHIRLGHFFSDEDVADQELAVNNF